MFTVITSTVKNVNGEVKNNSRTQTEARTYADKHTLRHTNTKIGSEEN